MSNTTAVNELILTEEKIIWIAFLSFLMISTCFGNSLVCLVILKDRSLRTPSNYFIVNMALGDLLFSLSSLPLAMIFLSYRETWSLGKHWNIAFDAIWFGFTLLSFINITVIACERYLAVLKPFYYKAVFTKRRAGLCCLCVWFYIASLIFALVLTFKTPNKHYSFLIPGYVYYTVLYFHVAVAFTLVPFFYHKIFIVAKRHKTHISRQSATAKKKDKYFYLQLKATWTAGLVILLFVLVWLPFLFKQLFDIDDIFAGEWDKGNSAVTSITYCNGAVNIFVYSCRNTKIRRALVKMLILKK